MNGRIALAALLPTLFFLACIAASPGEGHAACAARTLQTRTVSGQLLLRGPTNKGRYLIAVRSGPRLYHIVTTRADLQSMLGGEGRRVRTGQAVTVTFAQRQFPAGGFCLRANFLVGGSGGADDDPGELTGLTYAFEEGDALTAHACQGRLAESGNTFRDVRAACLRRDSRSRITLYADGEGYFTADGGGSKTPLRWYPDENEAGAILVSVGGRLHEYLVYDARYLEGAGGPEDGLPAAFMVP